MNARLQHVLSTFFLAAALAPVARAQTQPSATSTIVKAATAFLDTLDEKQRAAVLYSFSDDQQRQRWSNFPPFHTPRGGIQLKNLSEKQQAAVMTLVASALSEKGMEKVKAIMDADEFLKSQPDEGPGGRRGGRGPGGPGGPDGRGRPDGGGGPRGAGGGPGGPGGPRGDQGGPIFGKDLYSIAILGKPSETEPWMLQFGGHHLALNMTIDGDKAVITPTLTGAQPSMYVLNGKTVRPLAAENDKAFDLLNALDEGQRKQAILNYRVADLVLGPGQDGRTIQPEGLKVSAMNEKQRAMLLDIVSEWAGIVNDAYAVPRMEQIKAGLDDTYFAWSGPTTHEEGKNGSAYYRIQGPKVVIEFAPQNMGDPTLHVHTMYRDPTNDYAKALVKP